MTEEELHEQPYSNREIRGKWEALEDALGEILSTTKHTNGRVTALERWKYIGIGATCVLTTVVVPILSWALYVLVNIQGQINMAVDRALSAYTIEK